MLFSCFDSHESTRSLKQKNNESEIFSHDVIAERINSLLPPSYQTILGDFKINLLIINFPKTQSLKFNETYKSDANSLLYTCSLNESTSSLWEFHYIYYISMVKCERQRNKQHFWEWDGTKISASARLNFSPLLLHTRSPIPFSVALSNIQTTLHRKKIYLAQFKQIISRLFRTYREC